MKFEILGIPKPKQSARFFVMNGRVASHQSKEVKDNEADVRTQVMNQLPKGFIPYDEPLMVDVSFQFPPPKSFSKKKLKQIEDGEIIFKDTKPDLTDNLMKGLFDALEGILFINDSRICKVASEKFYSFTPKTILEIRPIKS